MFSRYQVIATEKEKLQDRTLDYSLAVKECYSSRSQSQ